MLHHHYLTLMADYSLNHRLEYYLTFSLTAFFRAMPVSWAVRLGMGIGWLAYKMLGIRRKVMLENLKQAFPEKTDAERRKIAVKAYSHWGGMGAEFAILPKLGDSYFKKYVTIEGLDVLDKVVTGGIGGINIAGHLGNWEVMGAACTQNGYEVTYVVANQSNKLIDKMMDDHRRAHNLEIWKTREAPRGILKSLKKNRFVALMIDQDAGRECVFVDFFGKEASTHRGPAVFHLKTGSPFILSTCVRTKGIHYKIMFEEVNLEIPEGSTEEKTISIMAKLTKLLEEKVRQYPEQYFWMHKRWKTQRPEGVKV